MTDRELLELVRQRIEVARNCAVHALDQSEALIAETGEQARVRARYIAASSDEIALHMAAIDDHIRALLDSEEEADEPTPEGP